MMFEQTMVWQPDKRYDFRKDAETRWINLQRHGYRSRIVRHQPMNKPVHKRVWLVEKQRRE
jgi:hypothetical protein